MVQATPLQLPIYRVDHYVCGDRHIQVHTEVYDTQGTLVLVDGSRKVIMVVGIPTPRGQAQLEIDLGWPGTINELLHMPQDEFVQMIQGLVDKTVREMQTKASLRLQA